MNTKAETWKDGAGNDVKEQKYNHLAAAEMMKEDNFNSIDGVPNNTTKPTFKERMMDAKNKAKAHNSRRSELHKEARHNRKDERHQKERR